MVCSQPPREIVQGPLRELRVVELGAFVAAPSATKVLADLGATVVKIEQPGAGDPFRAWDSTLYSPWFIAQNRGKQSLTLDLKTPDGIDIARRLVAHADVLVENFRPGVAARLGLGWTDVRELNPRLVYCSISGAGEGGPYGQRPGYDAVGQALGGLLGLLIQDDCRPAGPPLSDTVTGLYGVVGILAALLDRQRTGRGLLVETSLLEATMALLEEPFSMYLNGGQVSSPHTRARQSQIYVMRCSDGGMLVIHLSSPTKFWSLLLTALDREDLALDPRFASREGRVEHYDEIVAELASALAVHSRDEWFERLSAAGVPCAPVYRIDEVVADAQVRHLGNLGVMRHDGNGDVWAVAPPLRFEGERPDLTSAPPALGEDSDAVLAEIGYEPLEIARFHKHRIV